MKFIKSIKLPSTLKQIRLYKFYVFLFFELFKEAGRVSDEVCPL